MKEKKTKKTNQKKIKLKGSSFLAKRRPLNPKKKKNTSSKFNFGLNLFSKHKPLNKKTTKKTKKASKRSISKPLNNTSKQTTTNKYLPDIIEKRYIFNEQR